MKRFLVFEYEAYYPNGGMRDFTESFSDFLEALEYCTRQYYGMGGGYDFDIFDREFGIVVFSSQDLWEHKRYLKKLNEKPKEKINYVWIAMPDNSARRVIE